ncbi:MAG TPA: sigma-70 family RNA polymerase sigma factor [Ignavibacteriaceae bacterium]|nr:sigma-70 family RNA polymerase sigma factor [Ignavibacteriaceae bacterium]
MAVGTSSTDLELMERVASYDSKALEALYNRYSPLLYTVIKKIAAEESIAENVMSDVFVIIWRKANLFDFHTANVYTWLVSLARNKATDTIRRLKPGAEIKEYNDEYEDEFIIPHLSMAIDPLDLKTALSLKESVESALNSLTEAQQYVIYLAYYEGLTQKEIASKLNIPYPTVKSKVKIALSNLKENLIKGNE